MSNFIEGNIVDVIGKEIFSGRIFYEDGIIKKIDRTDSVSTNHFILPGFIDAHVHIESSMLVPAEFARLAVIHGTIGTVSDPHEIANVLGVAGVDYMINNGRNVPFHFYFGAPSCVPATAFETSGATIDASQVEELMKRKEIRYLAEKMNYPGVIARESEVMKKITAAKNQGKPIDGHAPGLVGEAARKYISAGISTDHECFTQEEALFKLQHGMKILIREGSAAKNFNALIPLLDQFPEMMMFCSDDKHPDDLVKGHINQLVRRALEYGCEFWNVIRAATLNPVNHYKLDCGLLRVNDSADFIVVEDLRQFKIQKTLIRGNLVAENGKSNIARSTSVTVNNFNCSEKQPKDFSLKITSQIPGTMIRVMEALDGQLITQTHHHPVSRLLSPENHLEPDLEHDILKFAVINRYFDAVPGVAFIKNFGLKKGAIASCVGHDSHNILSIGVNDEMICRAVNLVIRSKGGLAAVYGDQESVLPLPVAGIMSHDDAYTVAARYEKIDAMAKEMGSGLRAPFMTLSFMALLVIPQLKLSDKGLFDGEAFEFTSLLV